MGLPVLGSGHGFPGRDVYAEPRTRLVVAGAGFQGTAPSVPSLVHLPPPLAECVVGGPWSGGKVSRDFSKEHLCVRPLVLGGCDGGASGPSLCSQRARCKQCFPSRQQKQRFPGTDLPRLVLSVTCHW